MSDEPRMQMDTLENGEVLILRLHGRLTGTADAGRFVEMVDEQIQKGHTKLLVDLEGIRWVDSTGIGALVSGFEAARKASGSLRFACLNERMRRIMEVTKLDRVLSCYTNLDEGVASF